MPCFSGESLTRERPTLHTLVSTNAAVPSLFGTRGRFRGRQFFQGWGSGGSGGNAGDGERWGAADEALLARLPNSSPPAVRPGS